MTARRDERKPVGTEPTREEIEAELIDALKPFVGRPLDENAVREMIEAGRARIEQKFGPFETCDDGELYAAPGSPYAIADHRVYLAEKPDCLEGRDGCTSRQRVDTVSHHQVDDFERARVALDAFGAALRASPPVPLLMRLAERIVDGITKLLSRI